MGSSGVCGFNTWLISYWTPDRLYGIRIRTGSSGISSVGVGADIVEGGAVFAFRWKYLVRVCSERFLKDFTLVLAFCCPLRFFLFGFPVVIHRLSNSAGVISRSAEFKGERGYPYHHSCETDLLHLQVVFSSSITGPSGGGIVLLVDRLNLSGRSTCVDTKSGGLG